ncbi:MAG: hypothetical protein VCD00_14605, partial [Candidatus Hydrogenedentota bacterium]
LSAKVNVFDAWVTGVASVWGGYIVIQANPRLDASDSISITLMDSDGDYSLDFYSNDIEGTDSIPSLFDPFIL